MLKSKKTHWCIPTIILYEIVEALVSFEFRSDCIYVCKIYRTILLTQIGYYILLYTSRRLKLFFYFGTVFIWTCS